MAVSVVLVESGDNLAAESGDLWETEDSTGGPPGVGYGVLLEDGFALLQSSGDALLLEGSSLPVIGAVQFAIRQLSRVYGVRSLSRKYAVRSLSR